MADVILRQAGEGERLWFAGGGLFTMKASSEETSGSFLLLEDHVVKGKVTPLHHHPNEDEALYVLEGEILIHVEGQNHPLGKGGLFVAPRGVPHAFMVTSDTAHLLCLQTPGSGEPFYRSVSEPSSSETDVARPPDFARLRAAAASSPSIEILGPPPFVAETVNV